MTLPVDRLVAWLLYPGVAWVGAVLVLVALGQGRLLALLQSIFARGRKMPLAWLGALLCGLGAIAVLPWPNPVNGQTPRANLWLLWSLVELSQVLVLLPGLLLGAPAAHRLAVREAQMTTAGRVALWIGIAAVAPMGGETRWLTQLVAWLTIALALPLSLEWPPWGPTMRSAWISELPRAAQRSFVLVEIVREATLLALAAVMLTSVPGLPRTAATVAPAAALLGLTVIGRGIRGTVVEQRLAWGLRWWWNVVLPLALLGMVGLALGL